MSFTNPYPASRLTVDTANSLANGLVGFWPLTDGGSSTTAKDITTNANDGTQSGGVSWASTAIGTAASFDGVDDEFTISHSSIFNAATTGALSVSCWVYLETTVDYKVFVSKDDGGGREWLIYHDHTNGLLRCGIWNSGGAHYDASSSASASLNQWYHVAMIWDGSTIKLYVDGTQSASTSAAITPRTTSVDVKIGDNLSNQMKGYIQNVRIYNRALSATEVATLYNRPWEGTNYGTLWPYSPPAPADATLSTDTSATSLMTNCVGWWPLTTTTGNTTEDISGQGNDATKTGAAWEDVGVGYAFEQAPTEAGLNAGSSANNFHGSNFSVSAWVWTDEVASTGSKWVWGCWNNSNGSIAMRVRVNQIWVYHDAGYSLYATNAVEAKTWHHILVTYDGSAIRIYVDGALAKIDGRTLGASNTEPFYIGQRDNSTSNSFDGYIQNVRTWSRTLSADEALLLYERPFEGIEYGDAFHYDPPTPANLTPLTSDAINNSQIGWWPLTETDDYASGAADISGNANNGTQSGGVLSEVSRLGGVASFDGVDDQISSSATSTSPTTWSAWVYNDHLPSVGAFIVSGNASSARNDIWTAPAYYRMWAGTTYVDGTSVPKVKEWQHIVGIFDGASSKLYVDGVLEGTGNPGSNVLSSGITIGSLGFSTAYRFDGLISNVRLWSRALTSQEVWDIYTNPWLGSAYQASAAAVYYNYILRSKRFRRLS